MFKKTAPVTALAVLVLAFFYKIIFFKNIFLSGDLYYYYSIRSLISDSLKSFQYPLWTRYLTCGFPLMANPEAGVFDPLNIALLYFLDPVTAFNILICAYFFMAGLFTYLFCRSLGLERYPSFFSAVVFTFGGAFSARLVHASMIFSASFMPFTFWMINLFFKEKKIKFAVLSGLGIGLSFIPGHSQIAVYCGFSAGLYFLFRVFSDSQFQVKLRDLLKYALIFCAVLLVALGISAMQNLPTAELTGLSIRAKLLRFRDAYSTNLTFYHFITYIFPYFFGWPKSVAERIAFWGKGSFWELYVYLGIVPLCLLFVAFRKLKDKRVMFFSGLALFSLLFALGKKTFFFFIFFYAFPFFRFFKDPCRFVFISSFAMAVLSGICLNSIALDDKLLKKLLQMVRVAFPCILIPVIVLNMTRCTGPQSFFSGLNLNDGYVQLTFVYFLSLIVILWCKLKKKMGRGTFYFLALSITIFDLFITGYSHNVPQNRSLANQPPESVKFLKHDKALYRVYHIGADFPYGSEKHVEINKTPFFTVWGIPSANFAGPLYMSAFNAVFSDTNDLSRSKQLYPYLDNFSLFNVKYFTSTVKLENAQLRPVFDDGVVSIYENLKSMPRAFFVRSEEPPSPGEVFALRPSAGDNRNDIKITEYQDGELCVEAKVISPGFLVLSDTFYPGWKVFIDGKEGRIFRANSVMRAVFLREGRHRVRFLYDPVSFKVGLVISVISFITALFLCLNKTGERRALA